MTSGRKVQRDTPARVTQNLKMLCVDLRFVDGSSLAVSPKNYHTFYFIAFFVIRG